jgi:hypothetical protein
LKASIALTKRSAMDAFALLLVSAMDAFMTSWLHLLKGVQRHPLHLLKEEEITLRGSALLRGYQSRTSYQLRFIPCSRPPLFRIHGHFS